MRTAAVIVFPSQQTFEVRTLDISSGGMAIVAQANPRVGAAFTIQFTIPGKPTGGVPFEARAKVVHSVFSSEENGFKIGIAFTALPAASAAALLHYIR